MKKKVSEPYKGMNSKVGAFLVNRLLPKAGVRSVGPVFFLDHVYPVELNENSPLPTGESAHPHRGISTFSYVLSGSLSHFDSKGNRDIIDAGGIQWMKSGNGIIHDEKPFINKSETTIFHSLQFWILLPGEQKKQPAEYMALQSDNVPEIELPDHGGVLRLLLGNLGSFSSPITTFSDEFIYHIRLNPNSQFILLAKKGYENAVFVPDREVNVNGTAVGNSKLLLLEELGNAIVFENNSVHTADVFLFGGSPYEEPIIAEGPFVMNSYEEIAIAYRDFFNGKYGEINYQQPESLP